MMKIGFVPNVSETVSVAVLMVWCNGWGFYRLFIKTSQNFLPLIGCRPRTASLKSVQHKNLKDGRLSLLIKYIIPGGEVNTAGLCLESPGFKSENGLFLQMFLVFFWFHFSHGPRAPSGPVPPHHRGFTIVLRNTTLSRTPPDEWSARNKDRNTQHSYKTDNHTHVGIRTRNPSKRASPDPRLKARVDTGR